MLVERRQKAQEPDRVSFSMVVRWLTGHAFLGLQNFCCGSVAISFCRICGQVPERADHLLLRCPGLHQLRAEVFRSWGLEHPPQWEVDWILRFLQNERVEHMEDPTNTPEDISGRTDSEEESTDDSESMDSY